MKFLIFIVVCIYFVQTCLADRNGFTDNEIERTRAQLEDVPGIETKMVEKHIDIMKKYRNDPVCFWSFLNFFLIAH